MPTSTPTKESKEEKKSGEGDQLPDEIVRKIYLGEMSPSELSPAQQRIFQEEYVVPGKELPDEPEPARPEGEKSDGEGEPGASTEPDGDSKPGEGSITHPDSTEPGQPDSENPPKGYVPGEVYRKKADEVNDLKQKIESINSRLEAMSKLPTQAGKIEAKGDGGVYDEEHQQTLVSEVNTLKSQLAELVKNQQTGLLAEKRALQGKSIFLELDSLQVQNPELTTSKPFSVLDAAYADFQNRVGGKEARQKFLSDPEFRKQKEAEGILFPMSEQDWKNYTTLLQVHRFKRTGGKENWDPDATGDRFDSHDDAYLLYKAKNGITTPDMVREAVVETTKSVVESMATQPSTVTMPPSAAAKPTTEISVDQMLQWMRTHPYPSTEEEKRIQRDYHAKILAASAGGQS